MGRKGVAFLALEAAPGLSDAAPAVDVRKWIQILPMGVPPMNDGRKLKVDPSDVSKVLANALGRKSDIPILYEHGWGPRGGEAAGWIHTCEIRESGLWGLVSWTELAANEIRDKKWKYLSPGFMGIYDEEEFIHPRALVEASLTNTPAIDGMAQVEAANKWLDGPLEDESDMKEEEEVKLAEFSALLGLPEDADEEKVRARINELVARETTLAPEPAPAPAAVEPEVAPVEMVTETREAFAARVQAEAEKLAAEKLHVLAIEATIKENEENGRIVPATRDAFTRLAKLDLEATRVVLSAFPAAAPVERAVSGTASSPRSHKEEMDLAVKHSKKFGLSITDSLRVIRNQG